MKRETREWLRIVEDEYESARILFREGVYRMVCYHAQQTVEKGLKAVLTELEVQFSRTHNILDLRNSARELGFEVDITNEESVFLNSVYKSRYPLYLGLLPSGDPTRDDAEEALRIAKKIVDFVQIFQASR